MRNTNVRRGLDDGDTRKWPQRMRDEIVIRYLRGDTLEDIGLDYGITISSIRQSKHRVWFIELRHELMDLAEDALKEKRDNPVGATKEWQPPPVDEDGNFIVEEG